MHADGQVVSPPPPPPQSNFQVALYESLSLLPCWTTWLLVLWETHLGLPGFYSKLSKK